MPGFPPQFPRSSHVQECDNTSKTRCQQFQKGARGAESTGNPSGLKYFYQVSALEMLELHRGCESPDIPLGSHNYFRHVNLTHSLFSLPARGTEEPRGGILQKEIQNVIIPSVWNSSHSTWGWEVLPSNRKNKEEKKKTQSSQNPLKIDTKTPLLFCYQYSPPSCFLSHFLLLLSPQQRIQVKLPSLGFR